MAHLLCALFVRSRALGFADGNKMTLPLTQADFADLMGISAVYVNRMLQHLRRLGLIAIRGHCYSVEDSPGLNALGDFDAGYLHLRHSLAELGL